MSILINIALIFAVIMVFNFVIFIHELGHFWAARWRGLKVDRFQIWFGKPIWKKTVNGVQYGLGTIPLGGFVSLPQMAPMEAIEGNALDESEEPLEPAKPLDKIIVAVAGPIFSFLLAAFCALIVSFTGLLKPPVTPAEVGYVLPDSPAAEAGILAGDKILEIAGEKPLDFDSSYESVIMMIALSSGEKIEMKLERDGQEVVVNTGHTVKQRKNFFDRKGLREIGISPKQSIYISQVTENSPAALAGMKPDDRIVAINDEQINSFYQLKKLTSGADKPLKYTCEREGEIMSFMITPTKPHTAPEALKDQKMIGIGYKPYLESQVVLHKPSVGEQLAESAQLMWKTLKALTDTKTDVGIEQLSSPLGIGESMFHLLQGKGGVSRLIWFLVVLNINLAILNMLPFPVLDGGHIMMSTYELITRKRLPTKFLEIVQTGCVLILMSLFLYLVTKDGAGLIKKDKSDQTPVTFKAPEK